MHQIRFSMFVFTFLLVAVSANATEHNRPLDIKVQCNQNGAVVTMKSGTKFYLGKSCDAYQPGKGTGSWWWAASAFLIEIDDLLLRVPSDLDCPSLPYCRPKIPK